MILKSIRWEKPMNGWLTLNTDGSAASNIGTAGGGGLIRDENGDWVTGFARMATSFLAEFGLSGMDFSFAYKFMLKLFY
ncbi:hypothetical protein SO802_030528 [Lithocarpus litseifolius]|uniref:RNase H type-1 domain-containing protein n=1 Tax=Lithocarpus litseifolius TaxID=425828 RepID=A0AAW2BK54_9ROSI